MSAPRYKTGMAHFLGWLFFLSLPLAFMAAQARTVDWGHFVLNKSYLFFVFFYLGLFYGHWKLALPLYYRKGMRPVYFLLLPFIFLLLHWAKPFDLLVQAMGPYPFGGEAPAQPPAAMPQNLGRKGPSVDIVSIVFGILVLLAGFLLALFEKWQSAKERMAQVEADKAKAELSFLKAQINPHFLFNTLNNIYSMASLGHPQTASSILKLAHMMRYITEEAAEDKIGLVDEINCITDYIDLQKSRLGELVEVDFRITGNLEEGKIAPLVLMTFVENLFKYGVSHHFQTKLTIDIQIAEGQMVFKTSNPMHPAKQEHLGRNSSEIGLNNTRKRLEHLYPGVHQLTIVENQGFFEVLLILPLLP